MAIDFYKLGRQSGATTPKGQQSGFESLVSSATKPLEDMIKTSKVATAALSAAMPAGVPIDKVPEQLRGKVSKYLADNKKEYTDAAKVVTSGINPNSKRYRDAIETMNRVGTKFENLSNTLEDIAVKRKSALDDPSFSPATSKLDQLTFENLKNGSIYDSMNLNEDGTFTYQDGEGGVKQWKDFAVAKQGFTGQQTYIGLLEDVKKQAKEEGATFENLRSNYQLTINSLFDKLGTKGSLDYALADDEFLNSDPRFKDKDKDELIKDPNEVVQAYKEYNMSQLEAEFNKAPKYKEPTVKLSPGEEAKRQKKSQIKSEFDAFMKPQRIQQGNKTTYKYKDPREVSQYLNNLMPDRTFIFKYDDEGVGGYYTRRKSGTTATGEKIDWELVATEQGLTFDVIDNYIDYNDYALD